MKASFTMISALIRSAAAAATLAAVALPTAPAQAQSCEIGWTLPATMGPSPRRDHAVAYDSARDVTVLFGGSSGGGETWEWDGAAWTLRADTGPSSRHSHAMAYDSARGVTVLFGGNVGGNETWEWDGAQWTLRTTVGLSARSGHAMAYDSARGVTVLFGGLAPGGRDSSTYEWNGSIWRLRSTGGPTPRRHHAMAYDSARAVTVLFGGGIGNFDTRVLDTWEWNGASWTMREEMGPNVLYEHAMAYDSGRGVTVMFASVSFNPNQVWEWDGAEWTLRPATGGAPSPREGHAMAFDSARGVSVMFGGSGGGGETWEWTPLGTPSITAQPDHESLPPGGTAAFTVGAISAGPLTYAWIRNGQTLANGPTGTGSVVSGATTSTLTITGVSEQDEGEYAAVVSNACGQIVSDPATLTVTTGDCPADYNGDGAVNIQDFLAFLNDYDAGCP